MTQFRFITFQPPSEDKNITKSILQLIPTIEDDGKILTCRGDNPWIPGSAMEARWRLNVHCKWYQIKWSTHSLSYQPFCLWEERDNKLHTYIFSVSITLSTKNKNSNSIMIVFIKNIHSIVNALSLHIVYVSLYYERLCESRKACLSFVEEVNKQF